MTLIKNLLKTNTVIIFFLLFSIEALYSYDKPPKEILDIINAPQIPFPSMSPTKDWMLLITKQKYPSIKHVAEPFLRLAGVRIEPKNRGHHSTPEGHGIPRCVTKLSIVQISNNQESVIDMAKISCANDPDWSADGKNFYFTNSAEKSIELWIGNSKSAKIRKIKNVKLNPMFYDAVQWMPDQKHLLVKLVPKSFEKSPTLIKSIAEPSIQETNGEKGQSSTYEKRDTLNNVNDEKLFEYYGTSQLALIDLSGKITFIEKPALYEDVRPAPGGLHLRVKTIEKPFSYLVTYDRFPKKIEIWNISNLKKITRHLFAHTPLADSVPIRGVPTGPRDLSWQPTMPATLVWAEALDGGDWKNNPPFRDRIMSQAAPFKTDPIELFKTEQRYNDIVWFNNKKIALLYEIDQNKNWTRTYIVNPENTQEPKKLLWDFSIDEEYNYPGDPVYERLSNGFSVIYQKNNSIFLDGTGASPSGARPFLDSLDLTSLKTERLFRSKNDELEIFYCFFNLKSKKDEMSFLTWHQSSKDVPNVFKVTLNEKIASSPGEANYSFSKVALTKTQDPTPQIRDIKKRLVKYKRADGIDLSFTLYTPPGYKEGTRLPTILYAYPLDYADTSVAGQVRGSDNIFTSLTEYKLLLMEGYAILDNTSFPIIGDPKKAYDTYLDQLVANAKAAIDEAVRIGVTDPNRVGITGHSHGALMTANLVTHTNLFKAGVATSGSYNKTLTPFGFQSERRTLWEAPEIYNKVSPIFYADKIKNPLLIIHGMDDANPGTTPIQASFLYEAIRGNGGIARLVLLPHEPHWYSALESNEQEIYEMLRWFDKYLKY